MNTTLTRPRTQRKGRIRMIPCDRCSGLSFEELFKKESGRGELFRVVQCTDCELVQVNPQPDRHAVAPYYTKHYFEKRSDRGYDNYFSSDLKRQINRVYEMNLRDLMFFEYEESLHRENWLEANILAHQMLPAQTEAPHALDIGCAAGYFVEYLKERGWNSSGIELSVDAASFGQQELGLDIVVGDFLVSKALKRESYDLLTLWASIEHMHSPRRVLERSADLLKQGGRMILSTCRWGRLAKWKGVDWRFMNVPEHLYFFSLEGLIGLARECGLDVVTHVTYGSGFTARKDAGLMYRFAKKVADPLTKATNQGDMMALHLVKQ